MRQLGQKLRALPLAMAVALTLAPAVKAQPVVGVVTIKSIDGLMEDVRYVLTMAGKGDQAQQIDGLINALTGGQGLAGIDTKRPLGVLVGMPSSLGQEPNAVVFLPVTKEEDFLGFLKQLNFEAAKGEGGLHSLDLPTGQKLYLRFANKHVYASDKAERLKGDLPDPAKVIPAGHKNSTFAASGRLDQIPSDLKKQVIQKMDEDFKKEKDKLAGKPAAERQIALAAFDLIREQVVRLIEDSRELSFSFTIDQGKNNLTTDVTLTAKPGSKLAGQMKNIKAGRSFFSSLANDAAASLLVNYPMPPELLKMADQVFAMLTTAAEQEKDAKKRELIEKFLKAVEPSKSLAVIDLGVALKGPSTDGQYVAIAGRNLKEGKKLEQFVRDVVREVPIPQNELHIKMDHAKHGDTSIHLVQPQKVADEQIMKRFGSADIYVAVRDDALLIAFGKNGLPAIKDAIDNLGKTSGAAAGPVQLEIALSKIAPLIPEDQEKIAAALKKVFSGADAGKDKIRVTLQGSGDGLRLRMEVNAQLIKFAGQFVPGVD